jgi:diadenosine tetraphosphatase ApaH/serine/threonine PP2A family protein phosphatase
MSTENGTCIASYPLRQAAGTREIVNAGSVGKPKDGNSQACYVVLETVDGKLSVRFRRVPYDVERTAQAIEASEMPNEYAEMLRTGTG